MGFFGNFLNSLSSSTSNALGGLPALGIGSFVGSLVQNRNNQKSLQMSKDLKQFENSLQMDSWQKQFDAENARQDYLNASSAMIQKNSMRNAGLSPASLSDAGAFSNAVSSPSGAQGGSSMMSSPFTGFSDMVGILSQQSTANLQNAQAKNIEAQTKTEYEKFISQQIDNAFKADILNQQLEIGNSVILLNKEQCETQGEQRNLLRATVENLQKQGEQISANIQQIRQNIENAKLENKRINLQMELDKALNDATVRNLLANAGLSHEQCSYYRQMVLNLVSQNRKTEAETSFINVNGEKVQFDLSQSRKWDDKERVGSLMVQGSQVLVNTTQSALNVRQTILPW